MTSTDMQNDIQQRFLRYVKIDTRSDEHVKGKPTTAGQWDLLHLLEGELRGLGIADLELTEAGFLIARLPSNIIGDQPPVIGFMAHVDTSPDMPGKDVKPQIIEDYDGRDIILNDEFSITVEENPSLLKHLGETLITTDGTTLLGADDKAGVAEIMTVVSIYCEHPEIPHGEIEIVFTADEETGHGMDGFPVEKLHSTCCYTMDGGDRGEIEYECFYAYRADIIFTGVMYHPGAARGRMVNAMTMASRFMTMIPQSESPETTDRREGYYYLSEIHGDSSLCTLSMYLRDFDREGMDRRIRVIQEAAKAVDTISRQGTVSVKVEKQYVNMKEYVETEPRVMEKLELALKELEIEPIMKPIRGGTDGARLSEMGVPAPNIFAGGLNFHSRFEWTSLESMGAAAEVIMKLVELWSSETL